MLVSPAIFLNEQTLRFDEKLGGAHLALPPKLVVETERGPSINRSLSNRSAGQRTKTGDTLSLATTASVDAILIRGSFRVIVVRTKRHGAPPIIHKARIPRVPYYTIRSRIVARPSFSFASVQIRAEFSWRNSHRMLLVFGNRAVRTRHLPLQTPTNILCPVFVANTRVFFFANWTHFHWRSLRRET